MHGKLLRGDFCIVTIHFLLYVRKDKKTCSFHYQIFRFNLLNRDESCGESSVKLYRTLSEDKRCPYPQFLPLNSSVKRALLTSFPGSGNSWTRHLIEHASQIFTGSEYQDGGLYKSGNSVQCIVFICQVPIIG